jgi:hypothetical protein
LPFGVKNSAETHTVTSNRPGLQPLTAVYLPFVSPVAFHALKKYSAKGTYMMGGYGFGSKYSIFFDDVFGKGIILDSAGIRIECRYLFIQLF